ncbi:hypothetical protein Tco_0964175 [Tanacetum coccineum]
MQVIIMGNHRTDIGWGTDVPVERKRISTKKTKTKPKRTKPSTEWKDREKVKLERCRSLIKSLFARSLDQGQEYGLRMEYYKYYTRWIEKMESVQDMSGCGNDQKVKYTIGSFVGKALTWWNSQIHIRGQETAVGMACEDFKTLMREEFCLINEMQKLKTEFWNHVMVGAGHVTYIDRFYELAS